MDAGGRARFFRRGAGTAMRARLTSAQARLQSLGVGVAASLLTSLVEVLKCIFNFFTPTLHCESWAPFARAAVTS